jgi:nicotinamidase-related amidase
MDDYSEMFFDPLVEQWFIRTYGAPTDIQTPFPSPLAQNLSCLGVDTLVFTGCNFPNCPRASIYEASERDFRIVLPEDAISGLYPKGKEEMQNIGVHVTDADTILNAVLQGGATPV